MNELFRARLKKYKAAGSWKSRNKGTRWITKKKSNGVVDAFLGI